MKKYFFIFLIAIIGGYYFLNNPPTKIQEGLIIKPAKMHKQVDNKIPTKLNKTQVLIPKILKKPPRKIPNNEKESLNAYSTIMKDFSATKKSKEELVTILNDFKLEVIQKSDSNEETGTMSIIRTRKTLPGTRYFHAQYFADDQGQTLQHLSFELRPGPNAMNEAKSSLIKNFSLKSQPTMDKEGFISWQQKSGYTLWIKKLTSEDLKDDPFNAYGPEDVGTIRVAMELEIHGQYEGHQEPHQ